MKKIISICLCLTLILSLGISAFACTTACLNGADSYPRKGTVTPVGHGLFLREHHNTSSNVYGQLASNDKMNISYKWEDMYMVWYLGVVSECVEPDNLYKIHWVAGINNGDVNMSVVPY